MNGEFAVTTTLDDAAGEAVPGPFLTAPCYDNADASKNGLEIFVPDLQGSAKPGGGCDIAAGGDNTDFSLTWVENPSLQQLFAKIGVAPGNLVSAAGRAPLMASYKAFRQALEKLEASGCLTPGGSDVMAARVAAQLPLRLTDTLAYDEGLEQANRTVALRAGMRLRVMPGTYQYAAPAGRAGSAHNGYGATGGFTLDLKRRPDGLLAFDAFTPLLAPFDAPADTTSGVVGRIEGMLDLAVTGAARRYWRLIYPPAISGIDDVLTDPAPGDNVTLLGADTLEDLDAAVTSYVTTGTAAPGTSSLFFSGRAAVVPEVMVEIDAVPTSVTLGTTLADVLRTRFTLAPSEMFAFMRTGHRAMKRWVMPGLCNPAGGQRILYRQSQIFFPKEPEAAVEGVSAFDLPLVGGDVVSMGK
ncbi:MAG: hypothetical protein AAF371_12070 [Pseudomonadota bacterium]